MALGQHIMAAQLQCRPSSAARQLLIGVMPVYAGATDGKAYKGRRCISSLSLRAGEPPAKPRVPG